MPKERERERKSRRERERMSGIEREREREKVYCRERALWQLTKRAALLALAVQGVVIYFVAYFCAASINAALALFRSALGNCLFCGARNKLKAL